MEHPVSSERGDSATRPRVLVLLATYNGERWIEEQLRSILDQEGVDVRVVIRDDCSTDATVAVVNQLKSEHLATTAACSPSGSASQNFFALIRDTAAHEFDFVAFADQDDRWHRDKLHRACQQLESTGACGYSGAVTAFWQDDTERLLAQNPTPTLSDFLFEGAGQGCTFVMRTSFFERAREFFRANEALTAGLQFHDWTIYALARCWGLRWTFDSVPTMHYRQHGDNAIGAKTSLAGIRRRFALIRSGWYKNQLAAIAKLSMAAAPSSNQLGQWHRLLLAPDHWRRRLRLASFCALYGRRRVTDRMVLVLSALRGWI